MKKLIPRVLVIILLLFNIVSFSKLITYDYKTAQVLRFNLSDNSLVNQVIFGLPYYEPAELVLVNKYKEKTLTCTDLNKYADRLLEINERSSQAYFIKTVCKEQSGDLEGALEDTMNSLKYDKFNTVYLLSLAILQLNMGDLDLSQETLNKIYRIDPNTKNLQVIQESLNNKKTVN
jgi:tetratricopeptide (TPR) repeat protein